MPAPHGTVAHPLKWGSTSHASSTILSSWYKGTLPGQITTSEGCKAENMFQSNWRSRQQAYHFRIGHRRVSVMSSSMEMIQYMSHCAVHLCGISCPACKQWIPAHSN